MATSTPKLRAFLIRPFGTKRNINFDAVEHDLIAPALFQAGVDGRTTLDIFEQGNIRVDMFQRLLTADLVVADLSIHNANVFYELGIRHALRDKRTFLIHCRIDDFPFDLQTDRYFVYEKESPAASLDMLVEALRQTLQSEKQDSPVFHLLPGLVPQDPGEFLLVPQAFQEAVESAVAHKQLGDLELLAEEIVDMEWTVPGLRVIGQAQMSANAYESAQSTWEAVTKVIPNDVQASINLGTAYQRLDDLARSDQVLNRVLKGDDITQATRSEAHALIARNAKTQWVTQWKGQAKSVRRAIALRSPFLDKSYMSYFEAFQEDLNNFYPGLNALAMLTVLIELAEDLSDVWENLFEETDEAHRVLRRHQENRLSLKAAVKLSLDAALSRLGRQDMTDIWANISYADLLCLTSKKPGHVVNEYRRALSSAQAFEVESVRQQLRLYHELDVLRDNASAALEDPIFSASSDQSPLPSGPRRVVLFAGHMIDEPDRPEPRFPANKEDVARQSIREALTRERDKAGEIAFGLAGGASGGDLLFHEICQELGIVTRLYLALPFDQFIEASVAPAGPGWVERFRRLYQKKLDDHGGTLSPSSRTLRVLADSKDLPSWLREKTDYTIWQRNNIWMLHNVLVEGGVNVTVIALWNGEKGDGPGGTADLVAKAQQRGGKVVILNTKEIFNL